MRTNTFINRIVKVLRPEKNEAEKSNQTVDTEIVPMEGDAGLSKLKYGFVPEKVEAESGVVSLSDYEVERMPAVDLESWALDSCVALNGNPSGMKGGLEIVVMNYRLEAKAKEEEMKMELVNAINAVNNKIIDLSNQITVINDIRIPEKEREIQNFKEQIAMLENSRSYDIRTELGSELYTVLSVSQARTKEIVRGLFSKIAELKTEIEQNKNNIEIMKQQMSKIDLFNNEIVKRRLHIYYEGWLKGMEGLETSSDKAESCKKVFDDYL
jgi:hypothetical protein